MCTESEHGLKDVSPCNDHGGDKCWPNLRKDYFVTAGRIAEGIMEEIALDLSFGGCEVF